MQIQMPRAVLAETALDMLMLSYGDPDRAKEVLLGLFESAPSPQVPCLREDGSPNMIAEDGSECGTSPAWCWPFFCLQSIYKRTRDKKWLKALYPYLKAYMTWWLEHRTTPDREPFYKCSWESGQDCSPRFQREQPTGGELIEHILPVDLLVGFIQGFEVLSFFATELGEDPSPWKRQEATFKHLLEKLWQGGRYADWNRQTQQFVDVCDITHFSPLFIKGIRQEKRDQLKTKLMELEKSSAEFKEWASFFFQFCENMWLIGENFRLSEIIGKNVERIYAFWDRREWKEGEPLPGVSLEWWALEGPRGAEGYGWGATLPLAILRNIVGYRELASGDRGFLLSPTIPPPLWAKGRHLAVHPLHFEDATFSLSYHLGAENHLDIRLEIDFPTSRALRIVEGGSDVWVGKGQRLIAQFPAMNGGHYEVYIALT